MSVGIPAHHDSDLFTLDDAIDNPNERDVMSYCRPAHFAKRACDTGHCPARGPPSLAVSRSASNVAESKGFRPASSSTTQACRLEPEGFKTTLFRDHSTWNLKSSIAPA